MIIDAVDSFELTEVEVKSHSAVINTLKKDWNGLCWLNNQVARTEGTGERVGERPMFADEQLTTHNFVVCAFQWYATTAFQFVQAVGWLKYNPDELRQHLLGRKATPAQKTADSKRISGYVRQVIPEISKFRHKIAAHRTFAASLDSDTRAMIELSKLHLVGAVGGVWYWPVGWIRVQDGSEAGQDMRWSLTEQHRRLLERYPFVAV